MMRVVALVLLALAATSADACRCAQRSLAEYFAAADEVFVATLVEVRAFGEGTQEFLFKRQGEHYKSQANPAAHLPYVSNTSTAACSLVAEPGATYVVFAAHDTNSSTAWLTSCNGSRIHRSTDGTMHGFEDVPERFVISQLTALQGLAALQDIAGAEPKADDAANTSLIGLLDVAALTHTDAVPLFDSADKGAKAVATINGYGDLEHRESGYEVDAAVVYAKADAAYKLRLANGEFAWLHADAAGTFMPLATLLPNRLTYLTRDWNRLVWPGIGAGIPHRLSYAGEKRPREHAVRILQAKYIVTSLWLEVEVLTTDGCEGGPVKVLARGWIPAYAETGAPVAWYYSRGC